MIRRRLSGMTGAIILAALALTACAAQPVAGPSAPPSAIETPADSPSPSPTPVATADTVTATCENTTTAEYHAMMAQNGWVSWELPYNGVGGEGQFSGFPQGEPTGALDCRWGKDPDLATDNVIDLSWAPIEADAATEAQAQLEAAGYERIDASEGVYLAMRGSDGWADEEGYVQAYLFTDGDVRWAMFKDELQYVTAPDETD